MCTWVCASTAAVAWFEASLAEIRLPVWSAPFVVRDGFEIQLFEFFE